MATIKENFIKKIIEIDRNIDQIAIDQGNCKSKTLRKFMA